MIRKLTFAVATAVLLAGCVTSDYAQRHGAGGDYYYGQPRTEYRYHGGYGHGPYGGYGYPYSSIYYGRSYGGYPYGFRGGYYGYPYGPYLPGYRPPIVIVPRPDTDADPRPPRNDDDGRSPWRDLDELRRRQHADGGPMGQRPVVPARPAVAPAPRPRVQAPAPRPRSELGDRMRRLNETTRDREVD
ncbi:MAG: hypothetical protein KY442_06390 [Proteobacteria bacterium]|nr:hypothetical protein [Pseudomonadota bacterium]